MGQPAVATSRFELPPDGMVAARLCLEQRVPAGDPVRVRATARRCAAYAAELRHSADVLLSSAESSMWRGTAHRAFAAQLRSAAPRLGATADRYQDYAGALASYAVTLEGTVAPIDATRRQLRQRCDELQSTAAPAPAELDTAADLLPVARAFKAAYDRWADALDRCSQALLLANDRDPTRDLHGLRALAHSATAAAGSYLSPFEQAVLHPSLRNLSHCLATLNTDLAVLGVALLFVFPPAGTACLAAATVLAAAQVAVDATRRAHDEQISGATLGLEFAAAIPLGGNAFRTLRAADDVVHLVPGGGLMAHETAGGHTLAKHVGKTEAFLRNRLVTERGISGASTFYNREVAEASLHELLRSNRAAVNRWLSGQGYQLELYGRSSLTLGRHLSRGAASVTEERGVKAILRRTPDLGTGYYIHTAMVSK